MKNTERDIDNKREMVSRKSNICLQLWPSVPSFVWLSGEERECVCVKSGRPFSLRFRREERERKRFHENPNHHE